MSDCISCRKPKATLKCQLCGETLCKGCVVFMEPETFSYQREVAPELKHTHYCPSCHVSRVEPALESYRELLERAREVYFFFSTQRREPPILRRSKDQLKVEGSADRDETILRLGFQAMELGFNAVIEAEVLSEKIRNGGHQTTRWRGTGFAAEVDAERLEKRS